VIGGTDVEENEYPWLCSLKYNDYHICGLTLISGPPHHTILVGAAHCFSPGDSVSNYRVTCGEHSLRGIGRYEVTLQVTEVIIHPKFVEASTSGFDIGVYKVNPAPLSGKMVPKKLWPACLPDVDRDYLRETAYVAGWGITKTRIIQGSRIAVRGIPDIARHAAVTVTECRDLDSSRFPLGLICAAESGADSCQGDSGGPLTALKHSNSTQARLSWIGIVSYGIGCADPGYPGAYTRAACFLGFVAEQFGLQADFPAAHVHPDWSTDCPSGASRRSSSVKRKKHNKKNSFKKNKPRPMGSSKLRRKVISNLETSQFSSS
jgi:secreted trypsin-like serine protease